MLGSKKASERFPDGFKKLNELLYKNMKGRVLIEMPEGLEKRIGISIPPEVGKNLARVSMVLRHLARDGTIGDYISPKRHSRYVRTVLYLGLTTLREMHELKIDQADVIEPALRFMQMIAGDDSKQHLMSRTEQKVQQEIYKYLGAKLEFGASRGM